MKSQLPKFLTAIGTYFRIFRDIATALRTTSTRITHIFPPLVCNLKTSILL